MYEMMMYLWIGVSRGVGERKTKNNNNNNNNNNNEKQQQQQQHLSRREIIQLLWIDSCENVMQRCWVRCDSAMQVGNLCITPSAPPPLSCWDVFHHKCCSWLECSRHVIWQLLMLLSWLAYDTDQGMGHSPCLMIHVWNDDVSVDWG